MKLTSFMVMCLIENIPCKMVLAFCASKHQWNFSSNSVLILTINFKTSLMLSCLIVGCRGVQTKRLIWQSPTFMLVHCSKFDQSEGSPEKMTVCLNCKDLLTNLLSCLFAECWLVKDVAFSLGIGHHLLLQYAMLSNASSWHLKTIGVTWWFPLQVTCDRLQ